MELEGEREEKVIVLSFELGCLWDELENEFHLRHRSLTGTQYS